MCAGRDDADQRAGVGLVQIAGQRLDAGSFTVGPDYRKPTNSAPAAFRDTPTNWKEATPADTHPRDPWWSIFKDPILDGYIAGATTNKTLSLGVYTAVTATQAIASRTALERPSKMDGAARRSRA